MSYRILLVDNDLTTTAIAEQALAREGYRAASLGSFEEAVRQVTADCPDLLIAALRLGAFNGLHLLFRCRAECPDVPFVISGDLADLTNDIDHYGARFLAKPIDCAALLNLVSELLAGRQPRDPVGARLWPRKRAQLPATMRHSSARVVELSYGGLRLELPEAPEPSSGAIDVRLPTLGMSLKVVPRWSRADGESGTWRCGVEIALAGSVATREWRGLVDSLN